jgi:hypothetical protein
MNRKTAEHWKGPTSRKEREKWGTPIIYHEEKWATRPHEGQHVRNYQLGRFRGSGMDELWADIRQKQVGRILGLSGYEIEWLNKHITDFTELQNHIDNGYKD